MHLLNKVTSRRYIVGGCSNSIKETNHIETNQSIWQPIYMAQEVSTNRQ